MDEEEYQNLNEFLEAHFIYQVFFNIFISSIKEHADDINVRIEKLIIKDLNARNYKKTNLQGHSTKEIIKYLAKFYPKNHELITSLQKIINTRNDHVHSTVNKKFWTLASKAMFSETHTEFGTADKYSGSTSLEKINRDTKDLFQAMKLLNKYSFHFYQKGKIKIPRKISEIK